MPIQIIIVDDHPIMTDGLYQIFAQRPAEFSVVARISDPRTAVDSILSLRPDVLLMDIDMPGVNGFEILRDVHQAKPNDYKPVGIFLSMHADKSHISRAIHGNVSGYLVKGHADEQKIVEAVRRVAAGGKYFCSIAQAIRQELLDAPPPQSMELTTTQLTIAKLVAQGKSSSEIASLQNRSIRTVENHRAAILQKLQLNNTAELINYAIKQGW